MNVKQKHIHMHYVCLRKKDNLTHWDRYAMNFTGVCIGFNISSLRVLMQRMAITAFGVGIYDIGKVMYSSERKEKFIRNVIVNILNVVYEQEDVNEDDIQEIIKKGGFVYAASACT